MNSVRWKCKYCGNKAKVASIMRGRRVRCPACAAFSRVRKTARRKGPVRPKGPHFPNDENRPAAGTTPQRVSDETEGSTTVN